MASLRNVRKALSIKRHQAAQAISSHKAEVSTLKNMFANVQQMFMRERQNLCARIEELEYDIQVAKSMVPRYTAILPVRDAPLPVSVDPYRTQTVYMPVEIKLNWNDSPKLDQSHKSIPLHLLLGNVDYGRMAESIHVRFDLMGKSVAYGISRSALYDMPRERLIETISQQMANYLVKELYDKQIHRR